VKFYTYYRTQSGQNRRVIESDDSGAPTLEQPALKVPLLIARVSVPTAIVLRGETIS
jgi:hypothetical protein